MEYFKLHRFNAISIEFEKKNNYFIQNQKTKCENLSFPFRSSWNEVFAWNQQNDQCFVIDFGHFNENVWHWWPPATNTRFSNTCNYFAILQQFELVRLPLHDMRFRWHSLHILICLVAKGKMYDHSISNGITSGNSLKSHLSCLISINDFFSQRQITKLKLKSSNIEFVWRS